MDVPPDAQISDLGWNLIRMSLVEQDIALEQM